MIGYGFKAVRDSLRGAHQFVSENTFSRALFKLVLRTFDRFPALKRKAFQTGVLTDLLSGRRGQG